MTTPETEHKEIVRRMNDEVWGEGSLEPIDEYVAEEYVEHNTASPKEIRGRQGYKENVETFHDGFAGVAVTTENLLAEGNKVVNHYTIRAVHDGPYMGIEPTGSEVSVTGIALAVFEDGSIVEDWSNVDVFGLMQQLGMVEPPGV